MEYIPDNYDLFEQHEAEQELRKEQEERCSWCGEILGDTYYDISGDLVCENCIDGCRRYA